MKRQIQTLEAIIDKHKKVIAESEAVLAQMRSVLGERGTPSAVKKPATKKNHPN